MRLALGVGYFGTGMSPEDVLAITKAADDLGYHSVWVAEAYGSDVPTVLAWLGANTKSIGLGSGILQMTARAPAMTAMTAATLDLLFPGRMLLGLGLSGPQVVEGWYGQKYEKPLQRTREYVEIVRAILRREGPLEYAGQVFQLPLPESRGKALKLITHPHRSEIPIYLASIGPKNIALTGEIADGWLPAFFSPDHIDLFMPSLEEGLSRGGRTIEAIDIAPAAFVSLDDDLENAAGWIRPIYGLYFGGMGSKEHNFYLDLASRYGFEPECRRVQELYLAGDKFGAYSAVPQDLIDATALIGSADRVAERMKRYEAAGVTTLVVHPMAGHHDDRVKILQALKNIHP